MTKEQYRTYIESRLIELARQKYDDPALQRTYMIGFLTAQLADTMYEDTRIAAKFLNQLKKTK